MTLKTLLAALALVGLTACAATDFAERSETVERVLTVRDIDTANRSFTVGGGGQIFNLKVSEAIVNFDQIEVGDKLNVVYTESVAVGMALPSDDGETFVTEAGVAAPEGAKPAAAGAEYISTVVEFVSYDPVSHIALVRLEDGSIYESKVNWRLRNFALSREPGDRIAVDIASGFAVAIEAAE